MENEWAEALKAIPPKEVEVKIKPIYEGNSLRPTRFKIKYKIDGDNEYTTKILENAPGGK